MDTKPWQYHRDDETLHRYSHPLRSLAQLILLVADGHDSGYTLPLSEDDKDRAHRMMHNLNAAKNNGVAAFHSFIYPFLATSPKAAAQDKWKSVIECFLAVYSLTPDGNHKQPSQMSSPLAMLKYHCRGATLYEAIQEKDRFNDDLNE